MASPIRHLTLIYPLVAVLLAGCAVHLGLPYQPTLPPRPIVRGEKLSIMLDVQDRASGRWFSTWKEQLFPSFEQSIREAFSTEIERLGFHLARSKPEADAILEVVATAGSLQPAAAALYDLDLKFELSLRDRRGAALWESRLTGATRVRTFAVAMYQVFNKGMPIALNNALEQLGPLLDMDGVVDKILALRGGAGVAASTSPQSPAVRAEPPAEAAAEPAPPQPVRVFSDVDELPPASLPARPRAHAVVIGVRKYRSLPEADFADGDARLMARYLTGVLGFAEANVALMVNDEASRSDFTKNLERRLSNRVKPGDEVLIYYSGHGAPDPATSEPYLVPYDGDPAYLEDTGYSIKRLYASLGKLPAGRVTVILDSCFSGQGERSVLAKGARPLVSVKDPSVIPEQVSVLSSSAGDQISQSYRDKGHGLFTYYLLKGIKERVGSKAVDFKSVFDAAVPQVSETARRLYNADQTPQWRGAQP